MQLGRLRAGIVAVWVLLGLWLVLTGRPQAALASLASVVAVWAISAPIFWLARRRASGSAERMSAGRPGNGLPELSDRLMNTLTGHGGSVTAVAIAPDGSWLATASEDKTARIWAADGTPRATLTGHRGWVYAVAIAPDGSWLATASPDKTARIWAADGTPRATLTGHGGRVYAVAIAPGGSWLATASTDEKARLWTVDALPAPL